MNRLRSIIREVFEEIYDDIHEMELEEDILDEERITNKQASEHLDNKENFVGSHTYGEDLGGLGQMYAAYSYGEQHPLFVWDGKRWYHNYEDYILPGGKPNTWTRKHLEDLRPYAKTQGRPTSFLRKIISDFKRAHRIGDNTHTDLEPGEK